MSSIIRQYADPHSHNYFNVESVSLTGYISDNGSKAGTPSEQKPAYAGIHVSNLNTFTIDTRVLTLRTDNPSAFLVRLYFASMPTKNVEIDVCIEPPTDEQWLYIEVYANQAAAENAQINGGIKLYGISNKIPASNDEYSDQTGVLTFKIINDSIILKGLSPNFSN
jgi:hypothetical protein